MRWRYISVAGAMVGMMILPIVGMQTEIVASGATCADVEYIWMRGSGQKHGVGLERAAYAEQVAQRMEDARVAASYKFYEVDYPAIEISIKDGVEAFVTAGMGAEYGESIRAGIANLAGHIRHEIAACPEERFVLTGYSQGAHVISESLAEIVGMREKIAYVALLGDPKGYLPEGRRVWPATPEACSGEKLSAYRAWAPDCETFQGALLGRMPYVPAGWEGKVGLYCNEHDFMCGSGKTPLDIDGHLKYSEVMPLVAEKSVAQLIQYYPSRMSTEKTAEMRELAKRQLPMETVFLIDTSESMHDRLGKLRGKIVELAELTLASGGRVALAEYRSTYEEGSPKLLCGLSCGAKEFSSWLGRLRPDGEYSASRGLTDGLMMAYEDLAWGDDTAKSIVVVTDSWGGGKVSYGDAIKKSYSLGGVSTYIATWWATSDLISLASRTEGGVFVLGGDAQKVGEKFDVLIDSLVGRPIVRLAKSIYPAKPWETISFDAKGSYGVGAEIVGYNWDVHGNGRKERIMDEPALEWAWSEEMEDYIVVWAKDADGRSGMAAARVSISEGAGDENNPEDEETEDNDDERKVSFVPDDRKTNGLNTAEWIKESWLPPGRNSVSYKLREQIVSRVEDKAEDALGSKLSHSLGKRTEASTRITPEETEDLEVVDAGAPEESQESVWGWLVGSATLLLSGAGLVRELAIRRR